MLVDTLARQYDAVHAKWGSRNVSRRIYLFLIVFFTASAMLFTLNKGGLLPQPLAGMLPANPYYAIRLAFTLVLLTEVVELILALAESVALAMAKQLEIMSLIMLRDAFTDMSLLHSPIAMEQDGLVLLQIVAVAASGLALFLFRALFRKVHYVQTYSAGTKSYIRAKKCLSLLLLPAALVIGVWDLYGMLVAKRAPLFFETFYTVLVFTDILLLLIGQYCMPSFHVTFRNSGYAVSTLLMRISLSAPHYVGAALCVTAGAYALALAWATARSWPPAENALSPSRETGTQPPFLHARRVEPGSADFSGGMPSERPA